MKIFGSTAASRQREAEAGTGQGAAGSGHVGLLGLFEHPSFFWATGFAGLVIGLGFWVRQLKFGGAENGTSPDQLDNVHSGALVAISIAAAVWLLFVLQLALQPVDRKLGQHERLFTELWATCRAMITYSLDRGIVINAKDVCVVQELRTKIDDIVMSTTSSTPVSNADMAKDCEKLVEIHARLAAAVMPAMPKTLRLLHDPLPKGTSAFSTAPSVSFEWLGPVRLVRMMVGLVVVLIPLFVALSVGVGTRLNRTCGLFAGSSLDKSESVLYLIAASALGAGFAGLFKAFKYIGNLSYDDKYESSYWVRFILGVVAGLILAIIVAQSFFGSPTGNDGSCDAVPVGGTAAQVEDAPADGLPTTNNNVAFQITVPLLALVGGFSSDLVYRILKRIIEAIETLIEGSTADRIDLENQRSELRSAKQDMANKRALTAELLAIRNELPDNSPVLARLDHALGELWGPGPITPDVAERLAVLRPVGTLTVEVGGSSEIELRAQPPKLASTVTHSVVPEGAATLEQLASDPSRWTFSAGSGAQAGLITFSIPGTTHSVEVAFNVTETVEEQAGPR